MAFVMASVLGVLLLRWINPPTTAVILAWEIEHGHSAQQQWRPINDISPALQLAVIASEDQKFPDHSGFDFDAIKKAISEDRSRPRGASTITQQVAKNVFLWQGRSYVRKGLEAWFTILMEVFWPKQRILEVYLNIAEFGRGVYGAEAAAQAFFGHPARRINRWEAARLAAVLPSPVRMSAKRPSPFVLARAADIRRMMWQLGGDDYLDRL